MDGSTSSDPLSPIPILRSNGDYLQAQDESQRFLALAFKKFEAGIPLTPEDRTNLLKGAGLCAAMAAYLPGKAAGQDFTCGEALAALGYHDEAIQRYRMFLEYVGDDPVDSVLKVTRADAYHLTAVSLTATGHNQAALDAVNKALKAFPHTAAYLVDRAVAESALGQSAAARADLTEAATTGVAGDPATAKAKAMLKELKRRR